MSISISDMLHEMLLDRRQIDIPARNEEPSGNPLQVISCFTSQKKEDRSKRKQ